jgi:hypothetical protein
MIVKLCSSKSPWEASIIVVSSIMASRVASRGCCGVEVCGDADRQHCGARVALSRHTRDPPHQGLMLNLRDHTF